jgi:hypothetical protein
VPGDIDIAGMGMDITGALVDASDLMGASDLLTQAVKRRETVASTVITYQNNLNRFDIYSLLARHDYFPSDCSRYLLSRKTSPYYSLYNNKYVIYLDVLHSKEETDDLLLIYCNGFQPGS